MLIQYTIVGVIVAAACVVAVVAAVRQLRNRNSGCSGCELSKACNKKELLAKTNKRTPSSCDERKSSKK